MIKKLKTKFIVINMVLVSIVLIITFIIIGASTYQRLDRESYLSLEKSFPRQDMLNFPKKEIGMHPDDKNPGMNHIIFHVNLNSDNTVANIIEDNIEISDQVLQEITSACIEKGTPIGTLSSSNLRYMMRQINGTTQIAFYDLSADRDIISNLILTFVVVGFLSLAAFFIISLYLAKWALKPVEKSWEQQRQFIADASHELKTPLTVILANTDILASHKSDTIQNQYKWLEYIKAEATRMSTLVNDLLFLAKSDATKNNLILSTINFSDIVWSCSLPFESVAYEQGKDLQTNIESDIFLEGDEGKLKQLLMILLDNACKYTDKKGTIKVNLKQKQEKIYVEVMNSGEAISPEHLSKLFERFYRADEARDREHGGYGLGLSIAKNIVDMHYGKITVTSSAETGTIFTVIFAAVPKA
jgi:signal transduction histidine kinase